MYVLDKVVHARLIQDADHICSVAGIARKYLEQSMIGVAHDGEVDWFKNYPKYKQQYVGLVLSGGSDPESRMQALCGALIRNFIDARVMSLRSVLPSRDENETEAVIPTVLLVPNFYTKTHGGKPLAAWQVQFLYDCLVSRMISGKQTVLYVEDMEHLAHDYGLMFKDHLTNNYKVVGE